MAGDVRIEKSQIVSGSRISQSQISNVVSEDAQTMTPEMWSTVFRLVETYGKPREIEGARELKALLDEGRREDAKPIWQRVRAFLGDFANMSKIVEAMDALMR